jgi:hypothetical protein
MDSTIEKGVKDLFSGEFCELDGGNLFEIKKFSFSEDISTNEEYSFGIDFLFFDGLENKKY